MCTLFTVKYSDHHITQTTVSNIFQKFNGLPKTSQPHVVDEDETLDIALSLQEEGSSTDSVPMISYQINLKKHSNQICFFHLVCSEQV